MFIHDSQLRGNIPNWDKIDEMVENFDMTRKKHLIAEVLSGGEKRKLSVILALMGDSKVICLRYVHYTNIISYFVIEWSIFKKNCIILNCLSLL